MKGFSLIEILIASVLFGIVFATIYTARMEKWREHNKFNGGSIRTYKNIKDGPK